MEMMTDRELLEFAAKAAGYECRFVDETESFLIKGDDLLRRPWSPLTDDGDALRLAVKLELDICRPSAKCGFVCVWVDHLSNFIEVPENDDPYAATRRAIVRAASEIGRSMP